MSAADPIVTHVELGTVASVYPRTVGRNARLGSHGRGGRSTVAILGTDAGHRGWGLVEGATGETHDVVGRPLSDLVDPETGVRDSTHLWLDVALHDLAGVAADLPVHALVGGRGSTDVEVYDGALYFDDLDPHPDDPDAEPAGVDAVLAHCAADARLGHRSFKIKIGRGHRWMDRRPGDQRDIQVVTAVRRAWPDAKILVDANDGYDLAGFLHFVDATAGLDLYWVEEPFLDDADDLGALRAHLDAVSPSTRIADGESSPDVEALLPVAARHDVDVLLMDVISYGLTRWRAVMPQLEALGVRASPHAWGHPLKTLYAAQLAAGLGQVDLVEGVPGDVVGVDLGAYRFHEGHLTVPDWPGFGLPVPR